MAGLFGLYFLCYFSMGDSGQIKPFETTVRKHLNADALYGAVRTRFAEVEEMAKGTPEISLRDNLMSGFAMFAIKDPSLLAFDRRRKQEEHNLKSIFGMERVPCDTQMRTRLDAVDPDCLRCAFKAVLSKAQRGKLLENYVFVKGCYLIALDGTTYFSSEKRFSPYCLKKTSSKSGKTTYHLQTVGSVLIHPSQKEVFALPPEPISNQDGEEKNDCERNATRRWLQKFRKDHPKLKVIITEDGLSPNAPHIRDLKAQHCHFILRVKEGDHAFLDNHLNEAVEKGQGVEHSIADETDSDIRHFFRFFHNVPLNKSNQDVRVNVLEYWEVKDGSPKPFCWVTDLKITRRNAYQIMRAGRARWKVENETFNTLKNQGYNFEHNYGLGEQYLSMVFVSLMMLAFSVDQVLQMTCPVFRSAWQKAGSKRELWEKIRSAFHFFLVDSMEMIYRLIIAGPQKVRLVPVLDSS
jgi:hypothetical protein